MILAAKEAGERSCIFNLMGAGAGIRGGLKEIFPILIKTSVG